MIYNWKKSGLIYDDYNELYEVYIKTMECQHCKKEFTENNKRCLDHDHETGLFRKIVCNRCNVEDSYINYPNGYSRQEYYQANKEKFKEKMKEYRKINKQRISERNRQKIKCDCGAIVRRSDIAQHKRTKKHNLIVG
jgi:hypothetical protein